MASHTKDMSKGSIYKHIIIFAIPLFFSNLFQQLYNAVDSLIVGKFVGKNALAAVSSSGNLIFLFISFFIGIASGIGVLIGKYYGEKDYDSLRKTLHTGVAFGLICSIILTILGVTLAPVLLKLMKTDVQVLPESIKYFSCYFAGITSMVMYNVFAGTLNALGNSKRTFYYLIISSFTNIVLDLLFVAVLKLGVTGAALATVISQALSATLCLLFLIKRGTIYQIRFKEIKIYKSYFKQILKYGLPAGVQNSVIAIANVFVQANINTFGNDAMAGCGTYSKLEGFAFLPVNSFNMAITTFVSQNLGAKQYERAKKGSRFGILCATLLAELIGILMIILIPYLAKLFSDDQNVIEITTKQAQTICIFYFLMAFSHSVASVCRGAGKAIIPMGVMLIVWCIIRVIYIEIAMSISHEIVLVFLAYPITWFISSIVFLFYYLFSDWVHGFEKKEA